MRILYLLLSLIALLFAGCTHHKVVTPSAEDSFVSLNERAARSQATVTLDGGATHRAQALQITADSTSWIDPQTEVVMQAATDDVVEVQFVRHDRGALEGIGVGLLIGATVGTIIGLADGDDDPPGLFALTAVEKAGYLGIGLGLVGGAVGLPTGAVIGSRDVYMLETTAVAEHAEE